MQIYRKILSVIAIVGLVLAVNLSCSKASKSSLSQSTDEELFIKAENLFKKKKYSRALEDFKTLKEQFPKSRYLGQTQLYIGEIHLAKKEYEEAIAAYQNFITFYPTHPEVAKAQYQLGVCYYKQIPSPDRDQTSTYRAIEEFAKVRTRYPDSEYAQKAVEKILKSQNRLAEHEFKIAEFYRKERAYKAAISRLLTILEEYPNTEIVDKTLFYLGMNYLELDQKEEAELYLKRLIQNYPNNGYADKAKKELSNI